MIFKAIISIPEDPATELLAVAAIEDLIKKEHPWLEMGFAYENTWTVWTNEFDLLQDFAMDCREALEGLPNHISIIDSMDRVLFSVGEKA